MHSAECWDLQFHECIIIVSTTTDNNLWSVVNLSFLYCWPTGENHIYSYLHFEKVEMRQHNLYLYIKLPTAHRMVFFFPCMWPSGALDWPFCSLFCSCKISRGSVKCFSLSGTERWARAWPESQNTYMQYWRARRPLKCLWLSDLFRFLSGLREWSALI